MTENSSQEPPSHEELKRDAKAFFSLHPRSFMKEAGEEAVARLWYFVLCAAPFAMIFGAVHFGLSEWGAATHFAMKLIAGTPSLEGWGFVRHILSLLFMGASAFLALRWVLRWKMGKAQSFMEHISGRYSSWGAAFIQKKPESFWAGVLVRCALIATQPE